MGVYHILRPQKALFENGCARPLPVLESVAFTEHAPMRVYLDNCCYNRPFDDQSDLRTALETFAKLQIQALMRSGAVEYIVGREVNE